MPNFPLKLNDESLDICTLQIYLRHYFNVEKSKAITNDGKYSLFIELLIRIVQILGDLPETGQCDRQTWEALESEYKTKNC